jgi:NADH-quinone oxidoreductase subunit M
VAAVACTGVILSAGYALWLYRQVVLGPLVRDTLRGIMDMTPREQAIFAPLVVMTVALGVYPSLVTDTISPAVDAMLGPVQEAQAGFGDEQGTQVAQIEAAAAEGEAGE